MRHKKRPASLRSYRDATPGGVVYFSKEASLPAYGRRPVSLCRIVKRSLDRRDVLGTGTLGALALGVLDLLAFGEAIVAPLTNNRRAVEEDVSPLTLNETETLIRQLLNSTSQRTISQSTQEVSRKR